MAIQENKIHIYSQDSSLFEILDLKQRAHSISLGNPSVSTMRDLKPPGDTSRHFIMSVDLINPKPGNPIKCHYP